MSKDFWEFVNKSWDQQCGLERLSFEREPSTFLVNGLSIVIVFKLKSYCSICTTEFIYSVRYYTKHFETFIIKILFLIYSTKTTFSLYHPLPIVVKKCFLLDKGAKSFCRYFKFTFTDWLLVQCIPVYCVGMVTLESRSSELMCSCVYVIKKLNKIK